MYYIIKLIMQTSYLFIKEAMPWTMLAIHGVKLTGLQVEPHSEQNLSTLK